MKRVSLALRIGLGACGAALAGVVVAACFNAYIDPGLVVTMTTASFLCQ